MKYIKLTTAQALVRFLDNQYVSFDGHEEKFIEGVFTIFGHGNVLGIGQALEENPGDLKHLLFRNRPARRRLLHRRNQCDRAADRDAKRLGEFFAKQNASPRRGGVRLKKI